MLNKAVFKRFKPLYVSEKIVNNFERSTHNQRLSPYLI